MKGEQGQVFQLTGTGITNAYQASNALTFARLGRLRFWVVNVRSAGSGATTTSVKLQMRYNDGTVQTAYVDLPSYLDDVQGAAQPKGPTLEIDHAFASPANQTSQGTFWVDPRAISDITVSVKANAAGQNGDTTTVYCSVA